MSNPLVTINLVVFNGEKYLRHCLDAVNLQTYPDIEINILNNASTDRTEELVRNSKLEIKNCSFYNSKKNLGMWPGQEWLLQHSQGEYSVALSVDVLLHPDFVLRAVEIAERDKTIGAIQSKTLRYSLANATADLPTSPIVRSETIDTLGFKFLRSRRLINIGHGEEDRGQYDQGMEIFGVEGAAPFLRRKALEDCRVNGKIIDDDMFWYGDDLDLAWRMRLYGWKQIYCPEVIAYHDRSTTKGMSRGWRDYFSRIKERQKIPIHKRGLDWRNKRLARLKNDYWHNVFHDGLFILYRELMELGYIVLFEPKVLLEMFKFIRLIPKTLCQRQAILNKARVGPREMQKRFKNDLHFCDRKNNHRLWKIFGWTVGMMVVGYIFFNLGGWRHSISVENPTWWQKIGHILTSSITKMDKENTEEKLNALFPMPSFEADRLDILILGIRGVNDPDGGLLSDSIMLFSFDQNTKKTVLLSLPRDLYVAMPGLITGKINEVYEVGLAQKNSLDFTKRVFSRLTGLYVDQVVVFDFQSFQSIVDTLGGIDVNLKHPFTEKTQWGYEFSLPAGLNHLNGPTALYYVRSRYSTSDFDRARRQQEIIVAIKNKVFSLQLLKKPSQITVLIGHLKNNITTDLNIWDAPTLLSLAPSLDSTTLITKTLSTDNLLVQTIQNEIYILLPQNNDWTTFRAYFQDILR